MDGEVRALRFCSHCGHWVNALVEHDCPLLVERAIRAAQKRLEEWLGTFTIYQHEYD